MMAGWGQTGQVRDSESLERPMNGELPIMRSFNEEFDHPWGPGNLDLSWSAEMDTQQPEISTIHTSERI